jgi:hypothetical protein
VSFGESVTRRLSSKYGFDYEDALSFLNLGDIELTSVGRVSKPKSLVEKVEKVAKSVRLVPSIALPFCGAVNADWCFGIRPTHDLYAQCTSVKMSDSDYCRNCHKQCESNSSGKPKYGDINDRLSAGSNYEVKGRKPCPYGSVMVRLNITREQAELEASKFGWTIPESEFGLKVSGRGRPKTDKSKSDKVSDDGAKKSRGRPSKDKKVVSDGDGSDVIAALVAKAKANASDDASSDEDASSPAVVVTKKIVPKKTKAKVVENVVVAVAEAVAEESASAEESADEYGDDETNYEAEAAAAAALEAERIAKVAADAEAKLKADAAKVAAAKVAKVAAAKLKAETAAKAKAEAEAKAKAEAAAKLKAEAAAKVSGDLEEESVENSDSDDEEDDGVEVEVKAWTHKGKKYLKSTLNKVYDSKTQKPIGMWNEETDTIDPLDEEEEEDEEEEDEEEDE